MPREKLKRLGKGLYQTADGYQIGRMDSDGAWSIYEPGSDPTAPDAFVWHGGWYRWATLTDALYILGQIRLLRSEVNRT